MSNFLKDSLFGALVSGVYCTVFIFVVRQFGLSIEDYVIWMGISVGVIGQLIRSRGVLKITQ